MVNGTSGDGHRDCLVSSEGDSMHTTLSCGGCGVAHFARVLFFFPLVLCSFFAHGEGRIAPMVARNGCASLAGNHISTIRLFSEEPSSFARTLLEQHPQLRDFKPGLDPSYPVESQSGLILLRVSVADFHAALKHGYFGRWEGQGPGIYKISSIEELNSLFREDPGFLTLVLDSRFESVLQGTNSCAGCRPVTVIPIWFLRYIVGKGDVTESQLRAMLSVLYIDTPSESKNEVWINQEKLYSFLQSGQAGAVAGLRLPFANLRMRVPVQLQGATVQVAVYWLEP